MTIGPGHFALHIRAPYGFAVVKPEMVGPYTGGAMAVTVEPALCPHVTVDDAGTTVIGQVGGT